MDTSNKSAPGPAQTNTYLLVIDGKPQGPFTIEQLKGFKIKPGDFVRTEGMDDYKEAHQLAELRKIFGFPRQAVIPQYFGSFDQRLLAAVLDWFFCAGACIPFVLLAAVFVQGQEIPLALTASLALAIPLVNLVYHIIMESSAKQATYGKQILKITVGDMEGNRINWTLAAARNICKIFSTLPAFTGYLFCFFNKKQQCLHDIMVGTLVFKERLF